MHTKTTKLHPDFGAPPYGMPFAVVDNSTPTTPVHFQYGDESDPGPYPFTASTPIEGGVDRHAFMINSDTCTLYELFDASWNGGSPTAGSGAIFDLELQRAAPATAGHPRTPRGCRSSPAWCATTKCRPARSTTRSA